MDRFFSGLCCKCSRACKVGSMDTLFSLSDMKLFCTSLLFSGVILVDWSLVYMYQKLKRKPYLHSVDECYISLKIFFKSWNLIDPDSRCSLCCCLWCHVPCEHCWGLGLVAARFWSCCSQWCQWLALRSGCGKVVQDSQVYPCFWWNTFISPELYC